MNLTGKELAMRWGIGICIFLAIIFVGLGFWAASWGYQAPRQGADRLTDLGNFGSYLQGSTASFWALAGVLIIFVAFLFQTMQFADQRKQFKIQSDSISRQNFENKFFQLLNLHHKLVEDMVDDKATGRDCFRKWYDGQLRCDYHAQKNPLRLSGGGAKFTPERELAFTLERYDALYRGLQGDLGHYFRNLYHIIKFVDETHDIEDNLKKAYTTLVRAQLSSYEQALLFYNCIHPNGEEFYILIEKYSLFHNLDESLLLDETHEGYYDPKAYEGSKKLKRLNPRLPQSPPPAISSKPA
jgi:hypothetical protein